MDPQSRLITKWTPAGAPIPSLSSIQVPDYHTVIKDPVDLSLMETRLKRKDFYITLDIFVADFRRMMSNCR